MSYAAVTSVLLRCLMDGEFLADVRRDSHRALAEYDLDPATREEFGSADLGRLADLAGFVTKVKHNHLWEDFPYTRILLRRLGLELPVFRAYAAPYQRFRKGKKPSRREGIARFLDFLRDYTSEREDPPHGVVRDVLAHERCRWEIVTEVADQAEEPAPGSPHVSALDLGDLLRLVPEIRPGVRVGRYDYDPLEVIRELRARRLDVEGLEARSRWLVHVGGPGGSALEVVEVEPLAALLLLLADGRSPVGAILSGAEIDHSRLETSYLRSFLGSAEQSGLLTLTLGRPREDE